MTEKELEKFEAVLKKTGLEDDRGQLELYIVEGIECVDKDTIRRIFMMIEAAEVWEE